MLKDYILYALKNITKRKIRSWLTMIGIFIGIAAVVSLVSLGQGLQKAIEDQFQELGADKVIIQPKGAGFGAIGTNPTKITDKDVKKVETVNGVLEATGLLYKITTIEFEDKQVVYFAFGFPEGEENKKLFTELQTYKIESGRDLRDSDRGKVVLGYRYKFENVFDKKLRLGSKILVGGKEFEVIGFADKVGNEMDDSNAYMSESDLKELFNLEDEYDYVYARIDKDIEPKSIIPDIEKVLRKSRGVKEGEEDFEVQTFDEILESFLVIFNIVQAVVVGIAAISLLVGAIGIMNTMYTAVLERTKEIGVMKAIGAKNADILTIFVIEAGILGFAGGLIGVGIGAGISKSVEIIGGAVLGSNLLKAYFPMWLILGALAFSTILGMISGVLPAKQASKLQPVQALRYE